MPEIDVPQGEYDRNVVAKRRWVPQTDDTTTWTNTNDNIPEWDEEADADRHRLGQRVARCG